jgi:hypothetical protein
MFNYKIYKNKNNYYYSFKIQLINHQQQGGKINSSLTQVNININIKIIIILDSKLNLKINLKQDLNLI